MKLSFSTWQSEHSHKGGRDHSQRVPQWQKVCWCSRTLLVATTLILGLVIGGFCTPAVAGPALYFKILSPPQLPKMSFSGCVAKANRTINLRVSGKMKSKKSYALGWNSDVTAIVACYRVSNTITATVMVTGSSKEKAKDLIPQLVGDMRTPNF